MVLNQLNILYLALIFITGCTNTDGVYVPMKLPENISMATLKIQDGIGILEVHYPSEILVSKGKISKLEANKLSFQLKPENKSITGNLSFIWEPHLKLWKCNECIGPNSDFPGSEGRMPLMWIKQ